MCTREIKTRWVGRLIITAMLVISLFLLLQVYQSFQGPIEGSAAVLQLNDSDIDYTAGRAVANGLIPKIMYCIYGFLIFITWIGVVPKIIKNIKAECKCR